MKRIIFKTASLVKSRHSGLSGIVASVPVSAPTVGCFCNALKKNDSRQANSRGVSPGMTASRRLRTFYETVKTARGFTIIELMITMVVFVLAIAAASSMFTGLLTQFKQQSKVAETNIEGAIGLEMLRQDLEKSGYGLPWNIPSGTTYTEALSATICGTANPSTYNDSTTSTPRAIVSGNNNCTNNSDYLVIKAVNVATNDTSSKWTELIYSTTCTSPLSSCATNVCKRDWTPSTENFTSSDYINVISPGTSPTPSSTTTRLLMANSGAYTAIKFNCSSIPSSWLPTSLDNVRIVYGLSSGSNAPQRPFNRADYYIRPLVPAELPRCAPGTGVLEKAVMDYNGGFTQFPILDCVADMQVIYGLDMSDYPNDSQDGGIIGTYANADGSSVFPSNGASIPGTADVPTASSGNVIAVLGSAKEIRNRIKEVRVYVLAHEGQIDRTYTFNNFTQGACATCIRVGEFGLGRDVDLSLLTPGNTDYRNYRWKVYPLVVKPNNLK